MQNIEKNLSHLQSLIETDANKYGRQANSILLLAVSKKMPADAIRAAQRLGQRDFGENYLQEALEKIDELGKLDLIWHFIGAIQSNKTRNIAENFAWVHCVDRLKIAQRLSEQRPASLPALNVCIQVNLDDEAGKAGIPVDQIQELAASISPLKNIRLRGLMAIPEKRSDISAQREAFARLRTALQELQQQGLNCDTLSMGMSGDLEAAIAEGSTLVRIGTAIFGERT
ncbi:MAG: pyridoxal phosphate enzyme (YggS family) [Planctomycetota bacterium]|jgi:pyridoxal phosphate enzyme (YggS family)